MVDFFVVALIINLFSLSSQISTCDFGVFVLIVIDFHLLPVRKDCPLDWIVFGRSCYLLFYNTTPNWSDAQSICQTHGAHLPILHIYRIFVQLSVIKYKVKSLNTGPGGPWGRYLTPVFLA